MRKSQLEAIALTGIIEGKRVRGRQRKTFMDWLSFACGEQWKINDILKICQDRNEHLLIANVRVWHGTYTGLDWYSILHVFQGDNGISVSHSDWFRCTCTRHIRSFKDVKIDASVQVTSSKLQCNRLFHVPRLAVSKNFMEIHLSLFE